MAKNIIMQVLTSTGYEPMYPFNPRQILNSTFLSSSTETQFNITITGIPVPITNAFGNDMGIISFTPTINNMDNLTLSINGDTPKPVLLADGTSIRANTFVNGRNALVRYYNNNFYLLLDKNQIGLNNVENIAPADMPLSVAVSEALAGKLNTPVAIPRNSNLNNYQTAGMFYVSSNSDAATITNTPTQQSFSLFVEMHAGIKQTLTSYSTTGIQTWVRNYYNGSWSQWYQQAFVLSGNNDPDPTLGANGNLYLKINN